MTLQPVVHVPDLAASVAFYERLGGEIIHGDRTGEWVLMQVGTTQIALVSDRPDEHRGEGTVELHFAAGVPLEELQQHLRAGEIAIHRDFGPQLQLHSPEGLLIKISQREPDPYL